MFGLEHLPYPADPAQVLNLGAASRDEGGKNSPHEPQPDPAGFKRAEFLCAGITEAQRGY